MLSVPGDQKLKIAIDGPAGAGKSTVARLVAERLGYLYIDSGAMYRAVTWRLLQIGAEVADPALVARLVGSMRVELQPGRQGRASRVLVDDVDVTDFIRSREVSSQVPIVAAQPAVRRHLLQEQRRLAAAGGVVMDGRDIGTVVMPDADLKIFLTASLLERARRRWAETAGAGSAADMEAAMQEIAARDEKDSRRATSPLRQAEGALLIDSTGLTIEEVVAAVLSAGV